MEARKVKVCVSISAVNTGNTTPLFLWGEAQPVHPWPVWTNKTLQS